MLPGCRPKSRQGIPGVVELAGGAGASAYRPVEEAPKGLGGGEVFVGMDVSVVVEEDLSEGVAGGVPAEDGIAAAILDECRYRVDDRVQVAARSSTAG